MRVDVGDETVLVWVLVWVLLVWVLVAEEDVVFSGRRVVELS